MATGVTSKIDELLRRGTRDEQLVALLAFGRELLAKDDTEGAIAVLDRAVRLDGRSANAWALRAEVLARKNRAGDAMGSYDRALDLDAGNVTAIVGKADLLLKLGSSAEAIECYDRAVERLPEVAHIWLNRARALEIAGRETDAIESVDRALRLSDAPPAWVLRGNILAKTSQHPEAQTSYEKAVALDPSAVDAWYALAMSASKAKDNEAAKRACYQFLEAAGEKDARVVAVRSLLFQLDRHGQSATSGAQPRRAAGRISSSRMRRVSRAMKSVTAEDKVPPSSDEMLPPPPDSDRTVADVDGFEDTLADLVAADALHRAGRHLEALRKVERLVIAAPKELHAWVLRARVLLALGKPELAAKSAEGAVALDAASLAAWKLVARAALECKKLDRAFEAIAQAEKLASNDAELHRVRGDCLVAADRHTEAVYAYEKAVHYASTDADAWLSLGRVLRLLRRSAAAREALEKARDLADAGARPEIATEARGLLARLG